VRFALEQRHTERVAAGTQAGKGLVHITPVELVVAGHEQHWHRPVGKVLQAGPGAVDIARQHEQVRPRRGPGREHLGLEVQVGQQLDLHK